jgi:L-rhamnose mutarotase
MGDVMPSNADHSPVSRELREVFRLGEGEEVSG